MLIKVFTKNKNDKIELSEKELKELLDEAYWDGYKANNHTTWTWQTPSINWSPYYTTSTSTGNLTIGNNPEENPCWKVNYSDSCSNQVESCKTDIQ